MTDRPDEARSMDEAEEVEGLEDAELDDADLDEVAGGMMPASTKGGSTSIAFPDVCKTPAPPAPTAIPYPDRTLAEGTTAKKTTDPLRKKIDPDLLG